MNQAPGPCKCSEVKPSFSSPESIKLPKNFQPVGVTKHGIFFFLATKSRAPKLVSSWYQNLTRSGLGNKGNSCYSPFSNKDALIENSSTKRSLFKAGGLGRIAPDVGIERAHPFKPSLKNGMQLMLAAMMARLSEGLTNHCFPRIMFLSASPSAAAPKSGTPSPLPTFSPTAGVELSVHKTSRSDFKGYIYIALKLLKRSKGFGQNDCFERTCRSLYE